MTQALADAIKELNWQEARAVEAPEPRHPQRVTLDTLDTSSAAVRAAVDAAKAWAARKQEGISEASMVLSGPYGTGKTHIAKAILWSIVDVPEHDSSLAVPAGRFFIANDLLLQLSPQEGDFGISTAPRMAGIIGEPPILVLDDVGGQQVIPFVAKEAQEGERHARYFRIIDHCYTWNISVIVTTNLSLGGGHDCELARHIGGRAWDRLCEMAPAGFMVGLHGVPSWRVKSGGRS